MLGNDTLHSRQSWKCCAWAKLSFRAQNNVQLAAGWCVGGALAEQPPPSPVAGRETSSRSRAVARGRAFHQQQPRLLYFLIIYILFFLDWNSFSFITVTPPSVCFCFYLIRFYMESIKNCRWIGERKSISEEKQTKKHFEVGVGRRKTVLLNQSIHPARNWTKQTHTPKRLLCHGGSRAIRNRWKVSRQNFVFLKETKILRKN